MNTRAIEVVGTFQGFWTQWVRQVLAGVGHADVHTDASSWQSFDAILRMRPDSNVLVLVEHPAIGLAHLLGRGDDIDPEAWLDDWLASARTLLAHAQRNPDTTLVVNADEVLRRPQRLAQLLWSRWGGLFAATSRVVVQDYHPDALTHALAWSFIERDLALQDVVPELMASCVVLPGFRSATARRVQEGLVDGVEAARRLAELMQTERDLAQAKSDREAERNALRCELQAAADECARLATAVQALEAGRDRMTARTDAADRALIETRSRLEAEIQERNALAVRLDDAANRQASMVHELSAARESAAALNQQLGEGRAALAQAEEQRRKTEQELAQAAELGSTLERELAQAAEQRRALEQELAQAAEQRSTLEQELAQAAEQRSALEQELAQASKQGRTLEQELAQATEHRSTLEQELAQATEQRSTLDQELAQATEQRSALEQELAQATDQRSALDQELAKATEQRNTVEQALAQATEQRSTLDQELAKATEQRNTVEQALAHSTEQRNTLEQALAQVTEQRSTLDQELVQAAEQRRTLEQELAQATEQRSALEQELAQASKQGRTLEQELAQATEHRSTLEQELAQATEQRSTLDQELAQATEQRSALEQELAQATDQRSALDQELAKATEQRNTVEQALAQATEQRSTLDQELAKATEQRNTVEQALAHSTEQRNTLEQALAQVTEQRSTLDQELVQAAEQRRTLEQELAQATDQRRSLDHDLAQSSEQRRTLEQELAQASKLRRTFEQELTQAARRRSTVEQDLAQATEQWRSLEEELAQALKQRRTLEQELTQATVQRRTVEQELTQATKGRSAVEQDLAQATKQRRSLEQELSQATKQRSTVEQDLAQATEQRRTLEQELASAKQAARAAGEEGDLLLQQLHQIQEELERFFLEKRDAENTLLAAKTGPDPRKLEQDLRSAREECELLTLQTHQVQQELERVHAEKARLALDVKSRVALPGLDDIVIGEVAVIGERDTPPHREVSFVVRQVQAGERQVAEASLRLAEHWGRPGLVIFADDGRAPLFETWRESGREDGRPYMLLVHGEESAQAVYDAMGTLDWQLAQALAVRLGQALQDHAGDLSPAWCSIAQRLLTSLHEHPARLRYENVVVTPIEQVPPESARFGLVLEQVSYKGRTWQRLPIQWQPNGPTPSLDLVSDEESGPPLLAWPTDADGAPVRTLRLPLGDDPGALEIRAVWDTLSGSDRAFVAELLNLMPILAVHLQAAAASAGDSARQLDLQAAATDTMLLGRAALQAPEGARPQAQPRRPLLQRMASRLGVTAKPPSATAPAVEPALDR